MLQKINSKKRNFLLPFFALFYFVILANALHPYFHKHNDTYSVSDIKSLTSQLVFLNANSFLESTHSAHHSCPICDFFATYSVLKTSVLQWNTPTQPDQHAGACYHLTLLPIPQTGFYIRGPPLTPYW